MVRPRGGQPHRLVPARARPEGSPCTYLDGDLVEGHLPDAGVGPGRAALLGADALVRRLVVQRVGPERRVGEGRHHGGVVAEPELLHHEKLAVPSDAEERHAHA